MSGPNSPCAAAPEEISSAGNGAGGVHKRKRAAAASEKQKTKSEVIEIQDSSDDDEDFKAVVKRPPSQANAEGQQQLKQQPQSGLAALLGGRTKQQQPPPLPASKQRPTAAAGSGKPPRAKPIPTTKRPRPQQQQQPDIPLAAAAAAAAGTNNLPINNNTNNTTQLWAEKHQAGNEADVVIHKKKVQEVKEWLETQHQLITTHFRGPTNRVLILSGPPGSGKTALLRVLCNSLGFSTSEWQPPVPTLWEEYQYNAAVGVRYESKIDSFEDFVLRCKMPALNLTSTATTTTSTSQATTSQQQQQQNQQPRSQIQIKPKVVLLDDLPHAANLDHRKRLAAALSDLAATARFPIVICLTEVSNTSRQEKSSNNAATATNGPLGLHQDLLTALNTAGGQPTVISFNPITANNIVKALERVVEVEQRVVSADTLRSIAEQSDGDLHNALATLQFVCTGVMVSEDVNKVSPKKKKRQKRTAAATGAGTSNNNNAATTGMNTEDNNDGAVGIGFAAKDATLSLYHALGKLLYNKRTVLLQPPQPPTTNPPPAIQPNTTNTATVLSIPGPVWGIRPPMEFDPETVIAASGLDGSSIAAFLHENCLNFIEDTAVTDVALAARYLSESDVLASGVRHGFGNSGDLMDDDNTGSSKTFLETVAASVAARGVCFANSHPAPKKWQPLTAPMAFSAQRAEAGNKQQLRLTRVASRHDAQGTNVYASELLPYLRTLHTSANTSNNTYTPAATYAQYLPGKWKRLWGGQIYEEATAGPVVTVTDINNGIYDVGGDDSGGGESARVGFGSPIEVVDEDVIED